MQKNLIQKKKMVKKRRIAKCAYSRGYDEARDSYSRNECPYELGSDDAADWLDGWMDAFIDSKIALGREHALDREPDDSDEG